MNAYVRTAVTIIVLAAIDGAIFFLEGKMGKGMASAARGDSNIAINMTDARIAAKAKLYPVAKDISTPDGFINADPFTIQSLIGKKVILVDFWTYSCINCERTLPYLNSWYQKYKDDGLVIVGVHTPEFEFEQQLANVQMAVKKFGVQYPVVLDNDYSTWTAYGNQYWPREYLIDIDGFIVHDHIGEGNYDETEAAIVKALNERKQVLGEAGTVAVKTAQPNGADTSFNPSVVESPETYLGGKRLQYLGNMPSSSCLSGSCSYTFSGLKDFVGYELMGAWTISDEYAMLQSGTGAIRIRFSANKVNLVAGADTPVRAKVFLDGAPVTASTAGRDVKDGMVTFTAHDLYNLIDLQGKSGDHTLEIQFLDPGVNAFAFTFG